VTSKEEIVHQLSELVQRSTAFNLKALENGSKIFGTREVAIVDRQPLGVRRYCATIGFRAALQLQ